MRSLSSYLVEVKDYRRKQGQRVDLPSFLSMVILGGLSGRFSLQSLARFMKSNEEYFMEKFGLVHGVPKYTQTRTLLSNIDYNELNAAFYDWAKQYIDENDEEEWLSVDGKGLNSTIEEACTSRQNFVSVVSLFSRQKEISLTNKSYTQKKESEIGTAEEIVKELELKGLVLSLDALHCQKKRYRRSWHQEMTM